MIHATRFNNTRNLLFCSAVLVASGALDGRATFAESPAATAKRILDATGAQGGLIVHVGCDDGQLTEALRATDSFLVLGLDTDTQNVAAARRASTKQVHTAPFPLIVTQVDGCL